MKQNALINNIIKIETKEKEILKNVLLVLGGVVFLSLNGSSYDSIALHSCTNYTWDIWSYVNGVAVRQKN